MSNPNCIPPAPDSSDEWYRNWFDEDYLALYQHRDTEEARLFLENVNAQFSHAGKRGTIDLACGAGRHAWVLAAEYGWRVTGMDLSTCLLRRAMKHSKVGKRQPVFVRGDLRQLPFADNCCHFILNAFTSFGYFNEDSEHQQTLIEMSRILVDGGILLIDLMNPHVAIANLVPEDETSNEHWRVKQTRRYVAATKRIEKTIELTAANGERRTVRECVRLFAPDEMRAMLANAGLTLLDRWGDYQASNFDAASSERMICIAERT